MLSSYDRIIVTGTLPGACYAKGIRDFFLPGRSGSSTIRDLPNRFAIECASAPPSWRVPLALPSNTLPRNHIRKEDVIARVLVVRGDRLGLVHIISAMEACDAYKPWHDKQTNITSFCSR